MKEDWVERVSKPQYRVKEEKNIFMTMIYDFRLAADIHNRDYLSHLLLPIIGD